LSLGRSWLSPMKPETAKQSEPATFWELACMVVLVVLSCLGAWAMSRNCLIVFMTVFAALGVIVIMTPTGRTFIRLNMPGFSGSAERKS
jgi:hypothetical protein